MANALLSAAGYGQRRVSVDGVAHSVSVVSSGTDEARDASHFYTKTSSGSSFAVSMNFLSRGEKERLVDWLEGYINRVSDPDNTTVGVMRVLVAARNFDRTGIPLRLPRGDGVAWSVGQRVRLRVPFGGARDPIFTSRGLISRYTFPDDETARYFYPAGTQMAGEAAEDALYGGVAPSANPDTYRDGYRIT